LRGCPAIVFPLKDKNIKLSYTYKEAPLELIVKAEYSETLQLVFRGVFEGALKRLMKSEERIQGVILLENAIPMGVGMGFSAALCVVLSRLFAYFGWIEKEDIATFSCELEHSFHGKSSGVDVAGAMANEGVYFQSGQVKKSIALTWKPLLYLTYSHQISMTAHSVQKVQTLWEKDPQHAQAIDCYMHQSVERAMGALGGGKAQQEALSTAIEEANNCFERWGLLTEDLIKHLSWIKSQGALAAKPTGAGEGGYVVSLWDSEKVLSEIPGFLGL